MKLQDRKIAILAAEGFEQSELEKPRKALESEGATTEIVSLESGTIRGWKEDQWGDDFDVDATLDQADAGSYDALMLPGGLFNPDKLRRDERAVSFVKAFFEAGKPVGAICHGPQLLIEADLVRGRKMTSFEAIKTDLKNAGANWVDQEVVVDQGLVTSRHPGDLAAFNSKLVEEFCEGVHQEQAVLVSA